jgi:transcriptional regulator with XRE-family HTH domain
MRFIRRMTAREWSRDQAGEPAYFRALGAHVAKLCKEQRLTQAELARLLGISQQTVLAHELGDRRVSVLMLMQLAKIFGVPVEVLMGLTNSPPPANPRPSLAGIRHAECFRQLSKSEQRFVMRIIVVLLERKSSPAVAGDRIPNLQRPSQPTGDTPWTTRKLTKSFPYSQTAATPQPGRKLKARCYSMAT